MSEIVDESIVRLSFDNKAFEQGIQESIDSVNMLNSTVNREMSRVSDSFNPLLSSINLLTRGMSTGGIIVASAFNRLTNDVITSVNRVINNALVPMRKAMQELTTIPMKTGLDEYNLKMDSIQTIMASTGASIDVVNRHLDELNKYSDLTIYSFRDMTSNIGKFTNAGVKLEVAVNAMKGLLNEAAVSGANATEASRAMYNLAQSLSMGYVQYIDWKSIENANMATIDFKKNLAETAVEMGKIKKGTDGLYQTQKGSYTLQQLFKDGLKDQWLQSEVLTSTLEKYTDQTTELGKKAQAAATNIKTFSQMIDTIKEALQSGWAMSWQKIFGDLIQAKQLWTTIGNSINNLIGTIDNYRNHILELANIRGFRDNLITVLLDMMQDANIVLYQFKEAFEDVFGKIFEDNTATGFLVKNLTRLSEVLKDVHEKLKLNDQRIKALRMSFKAFFSVCELVWRAFDETGRAISNVLAGTEDLGQGLARLATLISLVVIATVEWIKESGKITSTINFIKEGAVELGLGVASVFESLGQVFNTEKFVNIFDQLKKAFENIKKYIEDFDFGVIDFSGIFDSFDNLLSRIGDVEINLDGFVQFVMTLGNIVLEAYQIIVSPLTSIIQVFSRFGNAVASIFERMSPREFIRLTKVLVAAATGIIKLYMKLDFKKSKQARWDHLFDGLYDFFKGFGYFYTGVGNFLNRFAFAELAGKIAEATAAFAKCIAGIADIIIGIAWLIGVATASAFVIKQFGLLPELVAVMTAVGALMLSITGVMLTVGTNKINPDQLKPFVTAMEMIVFQILALAASAALLGYVDNSIPKLISLTACVSVLTFVAGYIARELNNTVLSSGMTSVKLKIAMMASMVALISGMSLVLTAATRLINPDFSMGKLYLLEGAVTLMSGIIVALQVVMNELEKGGYVSSSWRTFGPLLGQITSLFAELIVSINFMVDISNKLNSISKLWNVVLASQVFTLASVIMYNTIAPLVPMDWAKAGSLFGQIAIFIGEAIVGLASLTYISNAIKDVGKFWTAIGGLVVMLGGIELLLVGVIAISKTIAAADFLNLLGAIGAMLALVLEMGLLGEALARISNLVDDPGKFIKISASMAAMFTALEVLTLGAIGIGAIIAAFPMIAGAGAIVGILSLFAFVNLMVVIVAELELFRESIPDQSALIEFLDSIGRLMLNLAAGVASGIIAGIAALAFIPYLVPLAIVPVGLGLIFLELASLYEKYSDEIRGMTMFLVALPNFFNHISEISRVLSDIGAHAKESLIGTASLIPMLLMISAIFGELLVITKLFSESAMNKIQASAAAVSSSIKPLVSVFMLLADFSNTGKASLKGMAMFLLLLPVVGQIAKEIGKMAKNIQGNKEEIGNALEFLTTEVFGKINTDVYHGMVKTISVLKYLSSVDFGSLFKATLGTMIVNFIHGLGKLPFMKQKDMMTDLVDFGNGLAAFAESISGITNFDDISIAIEQIGKIAAATNRINNTEGTLIAKLFGDNSIGKLGNGLGEFGAKLKELNDVVSGVNLDKNSPVDKVVDYIKRLSKARITNTAGTLRGLIFGDNSLETFGKELESFGSSFKKFAVSVMSYKKTTAPTGEGSLSDPTHLLAVEAEDMLYDFDLIDKVIQRISDLKFATTGIWNVGGVLSWFIGNNSIGQFGEELAKFGTGLAEFSKNIQEIDWEALDDFDTEKVNELLDWVSEATGKIAPAIQTIIGTTVQIIADSIIIAVNTIKESLTPGFVTDIINILTVLGSGIASILIAAKEPISDFFTFLTDTLPTMVDAFSSSIGNVDWLNAVADSVERICKSIQDLTTKALIPLLQNGIIPLVKTINEANPIYLLTKIVELSNNVVKIIALIVTAVILGAASIISVIKNVVTHISENVSFGVMMALAFLSTLPDEFSKIGEKVKKIIEEKADAIRKEFSPDNLVDKIAKCAERAAEYVMVGFVGVVANGIRSLIDLLDEFNGKLDSTSKDINAEMEWGSPSGGGGSSPRSGNAQPSRRKRNGSSSENFVDWLTPSDEDIDEAAEETKERFVGSFENSPAATHAGKDKTLKDIKESYYNAGFDNSPAATHGKKSTSNGTYWRADMYANQTKTSTTKTNDWMNDDLYKWTKSKIDNAWFLSEESKKTLNSYLNEYYPKVADTVGVVDDIQGFYNSFIDSLAGATQAQEDAEDLFGQNADNAAASADALSASNQKSLLSENEYWQNLLEIRRQGIDGAKYQSMELADFEEEILSTINNLYDSYLNEYQSKMSSFANVSRIFKEVDWGFDPENPFTKDEMFQNLQDQIDQLDRYSNVMASLNDRIDNEGLRQAINDMGVDSIEELETLNSLTESELDNYEAMYVSKMESATRAATVATQQMYDSTMSQIAETIGMPDMPPEMVEQWFDGTMGSLDNMLQAKGVEFKSIGTNISAGIAEGMTNSDSMAKLDDANKTVVEDGVQYPLCKRFGIESPSTLMEHEVGEYITAGIAAGMTNDKGMAYIKASSALIVAWYKSEFNARIPDMKECGVNLMNGLKQGIEEGAPDTLLRVENIANRVVSTFKRVVKVESPSKVFAEIGDFLDQGLALGIEEGSNKPENAATRMANGTINVMQTMMDRAYKAMSATDIPAVTPVVNMGRFQNGLRSMDSALANQRSYLMANAAMANIDTSVNREINVNNSGAVSAIQKLNNDMILLGDRLAQMQIVLDSGIMAGQMAPAMDSELGTLMMRSMREGAG